MRKLGVNKENAGDRVKQKYFTKVADLKQLKEKVKQMKNNKTKMAFDTNNNLIQQINNKIRCF